MVTRQVAVGVGVAYLSWSTWILHIKPATNRQNLGLWQHKQILVCDGTSKQKLTSTIKYTTTLRHPSVIHPSPPQNIRTHTTHALCICLRLCVCVWPGGNDSLQVCTSWPPNVFWKIRTYGIHLHSLCIQLHSLVKHTDIRHTVALKNHKPDYNYGVWSLQIKISNRLHRKHLQEMTFPVCWPTQRHAIYKAPHICSQ